MNIRLRFQLLTDPGPRQRRECFPPHLQNASQPRLVVVEDNKSFGRVKEPGLILADCLKASGMGPNRTRDGGQNGTGACVSIVDRGPFHL